MGKTIVVGGGTAGLAAAYALDQAGVDYVVLEKKSMPGGRAAGIEVDGCQLDIGVQFMFKRYSTTFDLCRKMGIADQITNWKPWMGVSRNNKLSVVSMNIPKNFLRPIESMKAGFNLLGLPGSMAAPMLGAKLLKYWNKVDFHDTSKIMDLDDISYADFTSKYFGKTILEYVSQPVASTLTLGMPEDLSAGLGLSYLIYMIPGLFSFEKGIGYFMKTIAERLKNPVKTGVEVTRIVMENKQVKGVEFKTDGGKTEFMEADNVICTLLAPQAADVIEDFTEEMKTQLRKVVYSQCTHVMMGVPGRPFGKLYAVATPRDMGLSFSGLTENGDKGSGYAPAGRGITHVFTYADYAKAMLTMTDEEILKRVIPEIRQIFPDYPDPDWTEIYRWSEAVCKCAPGQFAAIMKLKGALGDYKGLELAGEYMGLPAMETAVHFGYESGTKVARRA